MIEKVAIPSVDGLVNPYYGYTHYFTMFEIDEGNIICEKLIDARGFEHQHVEMAKMLKSNGVETVICGNIGRGATDGLELGGMKVLRGADGPVREVAETYAEGKFISKKLVCDRHRAGQSKLTWQMFTT